MPHGFKTDEEIHQLLMDAFNRLVGLQGRTGYADTALETARQALYALAAALLAKMDQRADEVEDWRRRRDDAP